jgi:hypothetical protein
MEVPRDQSPQAVKTYLSCLGLGSGALFLQPVKEWHSSISYTGPLIREQLIIEGGDARYLSSLVVSLMPSPEWIILSRLFIAGNLADMCDSMDN